MEQQVSWLDAMWNTEICKDSNTIHAHPTGTMRSRQDSLLLMSWLYMVHASVGEIVLYGCKDGTSVTKQKVHCPMGTEANTMAQHLRKDFIFEVSWAGDRRYGSRLHLPWIWGLVGKSAWHTGRFSLKGFGTLHLWWGVVKTLTPALLGWQTTAGVFQLRLQYCPGPLVLWKEKLAFGCCLRSKFSSVQILAVWLVVLFLSLKTTQFLVRSSIGPVSG